MLPVCDVLCRGFLPSPFLPLFEGPGRWLMRPDAYPWEHPRRLWMMIPEGRDHLSDMSLSVLIFALLGSQFSYFALHLRGDWEIFDLVFERKFCFLWKLTVWKLCSWYSYLLGFFLNILGKRVYIIFKYSIRQKSLCYINILTKFTMRQIFWSTWRCM